MSEILVSVENVNKKFCRSLKRSLWYGVKDMASELGGRSSQHNRLRQDEFWAVKDASFQVQRGEALGLVGHNGAGKTTLLRMLNGLIKPDSGRIEVRGRMQALIALGAGFNPVLTGRENIYINASVLGIPKAEIDRRYEEIVDFSGIREFINMPVQSYSTGMVVRLGFSIAAHLEPDVLLVDEVLAVGDLAFRNKCQLRIQELKKRGVAIIFVSHNLHAISHVCSRAIAIEKGQILYDGEVEQAIDLYRESLINLYQEAGELRTGTGEIKIKKIEFLDKAGRPQKEFNVGDYLNIRIQYETLQPVNNPIFNVTFNKLYGEQVTGLRTDVDGFEIGQLNGEGFIDVVIPQFNLLPNVFTIDATLFHPDGFTFYDRINRIATLKVRGGLLINGTAFLPHEWTINQEMKPVETSQVSIR